MPRAEPADVIVITGTTTDDTTIQVFINVANSIINAAVANGCAVTDATILRQAEAFLSAHFLVTSGAGEEGGGKVKTKERFENWSVEYAGASIEGDGITATTYGQTANMLMGGCLSNLNAEKASVEFFG